MFLERILPEWHFGIKLDFYHCVDPGGLLGIKISTSSENFFFLLGF